MPDIVEGVLRVAWRVSWWRRLFSKIRSTPGPEERAKYEVYVRHMRQVVYASATVTHSLQNVNIIRTK